MVGQQGQQQNDPAAAAIEHVLKVESDGVQQLQRSQEHAQQLLAQARAQAAAVGRRADVCISQLHNSYLQKVQRNIERLVQSTTLSEHADDAYDRMTLVQAARRVAAKLTGGG
jgi:vacuolar-type H+-ATPase subunit H